MSVCEEILDVQRIYGETSQMVSMKRPTENIKFFRKEEVRF